MTPAKTPRIVLGAVLLVAAFLQPAAQGFQLKSTKVPRYDAAVQKAVAFLQSETIVDQEQALASYALLKAGLKPSHPGVAKGIALAAKRATSNQYDRYRGTYMASVDAMLLSDADPEKYLPQLQNIADHMMRLQQPNGCWSADDKGIGDVSLLQYAVLGLWAAQRAGCTVDPRSFDRVASYLISHANSDGGWRYRPGTTLGPEQGASSHNMTLAAVGTLAISRLMLFPRTTEKGPPPKKFGVLEKVESPVATDSEFPDYKPSTSRNAIEQAINRGLNWNRARQTPVARGEFPLYFYYTFERAASLMELQEDWFTYYGDGLLTLQANDGSFSSHSAAIRKPAATSFAILFYMRSTQQIIDKQYGKGIMSGGRDPSTLFGQKKKPKELQGLDVLLDQMMKDAEGLDKLDDLDPQEIVDSIQFGSREELVGQIDTLKKLLKSNNPENRRAAYFALGRTGDFSLVPLIIQGLRDPNVDVNVEALMALRYISRKPNGFGLSLTPLAGFETADEKTKVEVANKWRTQAYRTWMNWYREIRPYEERGGLEELEAQAR